MNLPIAVSSFEKGIQKGIDETFKSLIDLLADKIVTKIEQERFLRISRKKFTEFIIEKVGTFPLFATSFSAHIEDVFVKLQLSKDIEREKYKSIIQIENLLRSQKEEILTFTSILDNDNVSPETALENSRKGFALIGGPGTGKTTVLKYLAVEVAKGRKFRGNKFVPIFIQVRDLIDGQTVLGYFAQFLKFLELENPNLVALSLLEKGAAFILLDGLDETTKEHQRRLVQEMEDFILKYPANLFCISSRPHSLAIGLTAFNKWEVQPMIFEHQIEFIRKWYHFNKEKGEVLIAKIDETPHILDLGNNPLFLSIICALFYNDLELPSNEDELYNRCVDGLLGHWDAFRSVVRLSPLKDYSFKQRRIIVNNIAAYMFNDNYIVFSGRDLQRSNCIEDIKRRIRKEITTEDEILESLYNDFGILVERAPSMYSFTHLTLQEYLVAEYIVESRAELKVIDKLLYSDAYSTILDFVIKLLPNADEFIRRVINYAKANEYKSMLSLIRILEDEPNCSDELFIELLKLISKMISNLINKSTSFMKLKLLDNETIEVTLYPEHADAKLTDAFSLLMAELEVQEQLGEPLVSSMDINIPRKIHYLDKLEVRRQRRINEEVFKAQKQKQYYATMLIALSNFKKLMNLLLRQDDYIYEKLGLEKVVLFKDVKKQGIKKIKTVKYATIYT